MWFKKAQIFKFTEKVNFAVDGLQEQLRQLEFTPCPAGLPASQGWIAPSDESEDLVYAAGDFLLICLQVETKILPASVVTQSLKERVKLIESKQERKLSYKERTALKQAIYNELLPQAFSKLMREYAFIDLKNNCLILNTNNTKNTQNFLTFFRRCIDNVKPVAFEAKKIPQILTNWLVSNQYPTEFKIEDACVLQDPKQKERNIRIKQQDLSVGYIKELIQNNYIVTQIKLTWSDQITFMLKHDFTLQSLQYSDSVIELTEDDQSNSQEANFRTDFFIMSGILSKMMQELVQVFGNC